LVEQHADRPEHSHWPALINAGRFDVAKAELSLVVSKEFMSKLVAPRSMMEAMNVEAFPTLATIKKYRGESTCYAALAKVLSDINRSQGEKKALDAAQIQLLCQMIFREYYYLTIAEIKYTVTAGLSGQYGREFYGDSTADVVMNWFLEYTDQRGLVATGISESNLEKPANGKAPNIQQIDKTIKILQDVERKFLLGRQAPSGGSRPALVRVKTLEQGLGLSGSECPEKDAEALRVGWKEKYRQIVEETGEELVTEEQFIRSQETQAIFDFNAVLRG